MDVKEILTLPLTDQLYLLKRNQSKLNEGDIMSNIDFYENHHKIGKDPDRQDYWIEQIVDTGKLDSDGHPVTEKKSVLVKITRLELAYAQQIISNMTAFLYGGDIDLILNSGREDAQIKEAFDKFKDIWDKDTRVMSALKKATRACGIETRSAIQFLVDDDTRIRAKVLSLKDGYKIYRHKDDYGKVDSVVVEYTTDMIENGQMRANVSIKEIWTGDKVYRYVGEEIDPEIYDTPLKSKKLLFAYLEQDYCEFEFVKTLIDKQDYARSQHSDVNVRIGNPALVVNGEIASKPLYNENVKIYEVKPASTFDDGSSGSAAMQYLEVSSAPESVKLEMEKNNDDIYKYTWPDLTTLLSSSNFGNLSGQSIKLMFAQAFVKLAEKKEFHTEFISRVISIIKAIAAEIYTDFPKMADLDIGFKYNSILPSNDSDMVTMLATAVGAKITSIETAVRLLSFNTPETKDEILREQLEAAMQQNAAASPSEESSDNERNANGVNGD